MAADRRRVVVFYGDSNTYGYDPADPYEQRLPYLKRWTTVVSRNLKGYWQVIPEGMNGRTIPAMPEGSPYLIKLPSLARGDGILCTMLGTNVPWIQPAMKAKLDTDKEIFIRVE